MKKFFTANITTTGRVVRALGGLGLIAAGFLISPMGWLCVGLVAAGCFILYEAVRGWCVLRACGIKTKL